MNARFITATVAALIVLGSSAVAEAAPSGREILQRQEAARKITSFTSKATLSTDDGSGARTKSFTWWRKLASDGVRYATLTRFLAPATIRNEAILLRERAGGDNDVLLYLPSFKKVRRVETQSQSSSFMGSVLSYSDVALPHAEDFQAKVLREEKCQDASCWVIEVTPASEKVKASTGYGRFIEWVRTDNAITIRGEYFDKKDTLWKKLEASDVREVDRANRKFLAHQIRVEDVKTKRVTILQLGEVKTNVDIPDTTFSEQNLISER